MFEGPTVFVVGAGASAEYDIAVGEKLKNCIADLLDFYVDGYELRSGDHQIFETLRRHSQEITGRYGLLPEHFAASRQISEAMPHALSIDNFVDAHRGNEAIELCAKLGIVKSIINEEGNSKLSHLKMPNEKFDFSSVSNCWLAKFFQMLHESVRLSELDYVFSNISIINFNYDRCVEVYLPRAISQYYGIPYHQSLELMRRLKIVHPYGMVGGLTSQNEINPPFGSNEINLIEAASGIRTFTEGLTDDQVAGSIQTIMREAETIVFLGFSYHPMNLELLANPAPSLRKIFGTTYGLSKSAAASVEQAVLQSFEKEEPSMSNFREDQSDVLDELELDDLKAFEFCTQYFRSLSKTEA